MSILPDTLSTEIPPYFKHMGDFILNDGISYLEAEQYIFDKLDDAAEQQDWKAYQRYSHDLHQLEDNYL